MQNVVNWLQGQQNNGAAERQMIINSCAPARQQMCGQFLNSNQVAGLWGDLVQGAESNHPDNGDYAFFYRGKIIPGMNIQDGVAGGIERMNEFDVGRRINPAILNVNGVNPWGTGVDRYTQEMRDEMLAFQWFQSMNCTDEDRENGFGGGTDPSGRNIQNYTIVQIITRPRKLNWNSQNARTGIYPRKVDAAENCIYTRAAQGDAFIGKTVPVCDVLVVAGREDAAGTLVGPPVGWPVNVPARPDLCSYHPDCGANTFDMQARIGDIFTNVPLPLLKGFMPAAIPPNPPVFNNIPYLWTLIAALYHKYSRNLQVQFGQLRELRVVEEADTREVGQGDLPEIWQKETTPYQNDDFQQKLYNCAQSLPLAKRFQECICKNDCHGCVDQLLQGAKSLGYQRSNLQTMFNQPLYEERDMNSQILNNNCDLNFLNENAKFAGITQADKVDALSLAAHNMCSTPKYTDESAVDPFVLPYPESAPDGTVKRACPDTINALNKNGERVPIKVNAEGEAVFREGDVPTDDRKMFCAPKYCLVCENNPELNCTSGPAVTGFDGGVSDLPAGFDCIPPGEPSDYPDGGILNDTSKGIGIPMLGIEEAVDAGTCSGSAECRSHTNRFDCKGYGRTDAECGAMNADTCTTVSGCRLDGTNCVAETTDCIWMQDINYTSAGRCLPPCTLVAHSDSEDGLAPPPGEPCPDGHFRGTGYVVKTLTRNRSDGHNGVIKGGDGTEYTTPILVSNCCIPENIYEESKCNMELPKRRGRALQAQQQGCISKSVAPLGTVPKTELRRALMMSSIRNRFGRGSDPGGGGASGGGGQDPRRGSSSLRPDQMCTAVVTDPYVNLAFWLLDSNVPLRFILFVFGRNLQIMAPANSAGVPFEIAGTYTRPELRDPLTDHAAFRGRWFNLQNSIWNADVSSPYASENLQVSAAGRAYLAIAGGFDQPFVNFDMFTNPDFQQQLNAQDGVAWDVWLAFREAFLAAVRRYPMAYFTYAGQMIPTGGRDSPQDPTGTANIGTAGTTPGDWETMGLLDQIRHVNSARLDSAVALNVEPTTFIVPPATVEEFTAHDLTAGEGEGQGPYGATGVEVTLTAPQQAILELDLFRFLEALRSGMPASGPPQVTYERANGGASGWRRLKEISETPVTTDTDCTSQCSHWRYVMPPQNYYTRACVENQPTNPPITPAKPRKCRLEVNSCSDYAGGSTCESLWVKDYWGSRQNDNSYKNKYDSQGRYESENDYEKRDLDAQYESGKVEGEHGYHNCETDWFGFCETDMFSCDETTCNNGEKGCQK
jgi:hypothetical protein